MDINNSTIEEFFTQFDGTLTKSINTDPLGFQIVWTHFGQKIFHNKTTSIALDIRSYNINLFNHFIVYQLVRNEHALGLDELITNNISTKEKIQKVLIILENILTWSWYQTKDDWGDARNGLLGTSKAITLWQNQILKINFNQMDWTKIEVLKNQRSLGVSGRYKGPFKAMGFFEEYEINSYKNSSELFREVAALINNPSSPFFRLYTEVIQFLKNYEHNIEIPDSLVHAFVNTFKNTSSITKRTKSFWLEKLGLTQNEAKTLYKNISIKDEIDRKKIFENSLEVLPNSKILHDIISIEPQLTYLKLVFDFLLTQDGERIDKLDNSYLEVFKKFNWDGLDITSSSIKDRVNSLRNVTNYKELIKYHKTIMDLRGQNSWLELKEDSIKVNLIQNSSSDLEDRLKNGLDNDWLNDYYLRSIKNIKAGLDNETV